MQPVHLAVRMRTQYQSMLKPREQGEQPLTVGVAKCFALRVGIEQWNVDRQHQQGVGWQPGKVGLEKRKLVGPQTPDIGRLLSRLVDHIIQSNEGHLALLPGKGIRAKGTGRSEEHTSELQS